MKEKWLWPVLGILGIVLTICFMWGFIMSNMHLNRADSTITVRPIQSNLPSERPDTDNSVSIVAIGDSLTKGYGDVDGLGYAGYAKQRFAEARSDLNVSYINFAVNGSKTTDLLQQFKQQSGVLAAISESHYVFLTIGGNDLNQQGQNLGENDLALAKQNLESALKNLDSIFAQITKVNPKIKILYMGLYNPYAYLEDKNDVAAFIQDWNQQVFDLTLKYKQVRLIPTYDIFIGHTPEYLWDDLYHPNQLGYKQIARRVSQIMEADSQ